MGALLLALATEAAAQLYQWTDGDGVAHYTADLATIPPAYRDAARQLAHPQARPAPVPAVEPTVIPFTPGAPLVVVARLNGVPLNLIVDTGADRTVISPEAIARAGFGGQGGPAVRIRGVTGGGSATLVTVPLLDVAGARIGPLPVVVHDVKAPGADGLLGRDVLDAFTLTVDGAGGRATLVPR